MEGGGYLLLLLPLGALDLVLVVAAWCGSLALLALPLYVSALPQGSAKFWLFEVAAGGDAWLVALAGLAGVVFVRPVGDRGAGSPRRVTCSWFLGPDERALQEARLLAAETGRAAAVGSAETERRRIERDLHDGAQQRLVSLAMDLGTSPGALRRRGQGRDPRRVVHAHEEAKAALQEIRDLVRGIHPVILEDRGLDAALSAVVAAPRSRCRSRSTSIRDPRPRWRARRTSSCRRPSPTSPATRAPPTPRCRWCARATRWSSKCATTVTAVRDSTRANGGTGLLGLRERATSLGGSIHLDSPVGGPTILRAVLPCE